MINNVDISRLGKEAMTGRQVDLWRHEVGGKDLRILWWNFVLVAVFMAGSWYSCLYNGLTPLPPKLARHIYIPPSSSLLLSPVINARFSSNPWHFCAPSWDHKSIILLQKNIEKQIVVCHFPLLHDTAWMKKPPSCRTLWLESGCNQLPCSPQYSQPARAEKLN